LLTGPFDLGSFLGQDAWTGTWLLADWYPVIAPWLPATGWYVDPLVAETGPAVSENALYDMTLTAPDLLVLVATGTEVAQEERGRQIERRWVTGPVRSFVVVADDDYSEFTETVDGTLVSAYADWEDPAMVNYARLALAIAVDSLVEYGERFGPYPYTELDVVVLPHLGGSGFAVSGMIFVSVYYGESDDPDSPNWYEPDRVFFEHAVAHEVGHQWWGISVESDYRHHTYLAEGLTNYLAVEFRRWTDGDEVAVELLIDVIAQQYIDLLATLGDQVADRTELGDLGDAHGGIVYGKAALGFLAIHVEIGDEAFYSALRVYADEFAFGISTPADLLRIFEEASGRDLDELWRHWFEEAETTADDVRNLIRAA
jgi:aminopeptidase N